MSLAPHLHIFSDARTWVLMNLISIAMQQLQNNTNLGTIEQCVIIPLFFVISVRFFTETRMRSCKFIIAFVFQGNPPKIPSGGLCLLFFLSKTCQFNMYFGTKGRTIENNRYSVMARVGKPNLCIFRKIKAIP